MTRFSLDKKQISNPLMEEVCLSERLRTQLLPTSLDLVFMYPLDQFTKTEKFGSSIRWYQQEKIAVVARLRPTKPSPNVPWIRDRRRQGFRGFPGKNGENGGTRSTNHGFSKSIRFFLGKLIKRQKTWAAKIKPKTHLRMA